MRNKTEKTNILMIRDSSTKMKVKMRKQNTSKSRLNADVATAVDSFDWYISAVSFLCLPLKPFEGAEEGQVRDFKKLQGIKARVRQSHNGESSVKRRNYLVISISPSVNSSMLITLFSMNLYLFPHQQALWILTESHVFLSVSLCCFYNVYHFRFSIVHGADYCGGKLNPLPSAPTTSFAPCSLAYSRGMKVRLKVSLTRVIGDPLCMGLKLNSPEFI